MARQNSIMIGSPVQSLSFVLINDFIVNTVLKNDNYY